ncbi:MAG: hypothetical protein COR54_17275 [Elusimicrobia bacterium CG22_combo_CG10-13_8_21_14_all_63_91]|nr:MAG: hypothetical protein COR54_17275 [Elusimicrobia bacterium CG22_combo_CG10-13_8_21_14_all_63_91]
MHAATEISIESNCPRGQFPVRSGAEIRFLYCIVVPHVFRPTPRSAPKWLNDPSGLADHLLRDCA